MANTDFNFHVLMDVHAIKLISDVQSQYIDEPIIHIKK